MTANLIAQVVENYYHKLDLDKMAAPWKGIEKYSYGRVTDEWVNRELKDETYLRWCKAIGLLESYCKQHFDSFQETDLVYKWAKRVCEERNHAKNEWKAYGGYQSFSSFLTRKNRF